MRRALLSTRLALRSCTVLQTKPLRTRSALSTLELSHHCDTGVAASSRAAMGVTIANVLNKWNKDELKKIRIVCSDKNKTSLPDQVDKALRKLYKDNGDRIPARAPLALAFDTSTAAAASSGYFDVARDGVHDIARNSFHSLPTFLDACSRNIILETFLQHKKLHSGLHPRRRIDAVES